jgi:hypothetical protein
MLGQSRITNRKINIHSDATSIQTNQSLVCRIPVTPIYVPPYFTRLWHISASFVVVDDSTIIDSHRLFISVCIGGDNVYNACEDYSVTSKLGASRIVRFDLFADIPANNTATEVKVYTTCTSDSCYLSANRGVYTSQFQAGMSFVSVADVSGI